MTPKSFFYLLICLLTPITTPAQILQELVSAEVTIKRDKVYVNEHFQLEISLTSTGLSLDQNLQLLSMPDNSRLIMGEFRELPPERSMQGNQIKEKRRFICDARAIKADTIEVAPILRIGILSGFGLFRQISRNDIKAKALSLSIIPLPEAGRPESFSGAIGQFSMETSLSSDTAAVGDLITMNTTIRGKGYLDPISPIRIPTSPSFKVYPSRNIPSADANTKTFEQILIPQSTNAVIIPAVTFCYFDPLDNTYKSISKGPIPVTILSHKKTVTESIYKPARASKPGNVLAGQSINTGKPAPRKDIRKIRITAAVSYWLIIIISSLIITIRYTKGSIAALILLIIAAIISLPLWNILQLSINEATVVRNEKARVAPAYSAISCFDISHDATIRVLDQHGAWVKVEIEGKRGWLPSDSLTNSCVNNVDAD